MITARGTRTHSAALKNGIWLGAVVISPWVTLPGGSGGLTGVRSMEKTQLAQVTGHEAISPSGASASASLPVGKGKAEAWSTPAVAPG